MVKASGGVKVNFSNSNMSSSFVNVKAVSYKNKVDVSQKYDEVDYSEQTITNAPEKKVEQSKSVDFLKPLQKGAQSLLYDVYFKSGVAEDCPELGNCVIISMLYKTMFGTITGQDESFGDVLKSYAKNFTKEYAKQIKDVEGIKSIAATPVFKKVVKEKLGGLSTDFVDKVKEKDLKNLLKKEYPGAFKSLQNNMAWGSLGSMGIGIGIDYGASLLSNMVSGFLEGKGFKETFASENMKYGSTLLKSTTKTICAVGLELIGTSIGGEVGAKVGKIVGTAIGTFIGELQVQLLDGDEKWCAIAAGAEIAGAVVGVVIAVFLCSNPVGWAVGLGMIVGAAVAFGAVCLIKNWDVVWSFTKSAVCAIANFAVNLVKDVAATILTGLVLQAVFVYKATKVISNAVVEIAKEIYTGVEEAIEWVEATKKRSSSFSICSR